MERFTDVDDGIDYVSRTKAALYTCIVRRQWHNVARLGGFKSEHEARVKHDPSYSVVFATIKPEPVTPKSIAPSRRVKASSAGFCQSSCNASEPWVIAFLQQAKSRMSILGIERKHVADQIGISRSTLGACFAARTGYLSKSMMARIDKALSELEAGRIAA